jgi:Ion channel
MFIKLVAALLATNIAFAGCLFPWVTDNDFTGLRKNGSERFADLFYFSVASFSTAGYGDIAPKTTRAKMAVSFFLLFVNIAALYGIYNALTSR